MTAVPAPASSDFKLPPYTYTGLLDDVILRYSDEFKGADFFRKMIAKNVLFGGGVFINDGYLVNHPIAREHLATDGSLLRVMLNVGFVRVLTRADSGESLARMPVTMAESGNESFKDLIGSSEWTEFGPVFKRIALQVFRTGNRRNWPKVNMSYGYTKLMEQHMVGKTASAMGFSVLNTDDVRFISDRFLELDPCQGNARDKFEKAASQMLQKRDRFSRDAMREIMDVANQCYHYNFGLAMTWDLEKDGIGAGIAVDTTIGKTFGDMLATEPVCSDQLNHIPLLGIPEDFPFHDGAFFLEILDTTSAIGQAKTRYLQQLNVLLSSNLSETGEIRLHNTKKEMNDATEEYQMRISEHLAQRYHGISPGSYPLKVMSGYMKDSVEAVESQFVMAIRLQEQEKAASRTRDILFKRFRLTDLPENDKERSDRVITVADIRPQIASLGFDQEQATEFLTGLPEIS